MLANSDALLLQLELPIEVSLRAAEIAKAGGSMVVLNASPIPDVIDTSLQTLLKLTSVLVVNGIEAERLLNQKMPPIKAAQKLADQFAIATVVITQGAEGVVAFHEGKVIWQKAYAAEVVDTVGAGDAFLGTFVAGMLNGLALPQILDRAIAAGAITVTRKGAYNALPNAAEVDAFLKRAH
jgi:ribokinase